MIFVSDEIPDSEDENNYGHPSSRNERSTIELLVNVFFF